MPRTYRQSLARRPSLSTIDSEENIRQCTESPIHRVQPSVTSFSRRDLYTPSQLHSTPRHSFSEPQRPHSFLEKPFVPSPATVQQAWIAHQPQHSPVSSTTPRASFPNRPNNQSQYQSQDQPQYQSTQTVMAQETGILPPRPGMARIPSTQTRYMEMLLHLDRIPRVYNIIAGACTWILLASFLIIPGTFTSFKNSDMFKNAENSDTDKSDIAKAIIHSAANVGLLWLSGALCVIGGLGCLFLWFRWRKNYVWLVNKVFLPALLNSFAGLLTTIVNVYTAQKGVWSVTAKITAITTGRLIAISGSLFTAYNFWMLEKVRDDHEKTYQSEQKYYEG